MDKLFFFMVDESEARGYKYLNILAGCADVQHGTYLVRCDVLHAAVNAQTVIHMVDYTIRVGI